MDSVSTVLAEEDTSFGIMLEAQVQQHQVSHCLVQDVFLEGNRVFAKLRSATMAREQAHPVALGDPQVVDLKNLDAIFVRKDPPFDDAYLWLTLMLEHLRGETLVVNDPRGLRDANEKLYACHFPAWIPETTVTASAERIKKFILQVGGKAVIKPVDGHGGEGIFVLTDGDLNTNAIIETATRHGTRVAMVQRFLPEVREGDKRILVLDGEPLGAILRVPKRDDARSNIHVGGSVLAAELTDDDRSMVQSMKSKLREDGLVFVGLDVIGGRLTEVNVTSPTGIQQASRLSGQNLEANVVQWLDSHRH